MSEIHEDMELWGQRLAKGGRTLRSRFGVEPADSGAGGYNEVLDILGDGEAHTIETIDGYLEHSGIELSGCQIAAILGSIELSGRRFEMLGPYDIFGSPARFKLIEQEVAA